MRMSTIDVDVVGINGDNNGWRNIVLDSVVVFAIFFLIVLTVFFLSLRIALLFCY